MDLIKKIETKFSRGLELRSVDGNEQQTITGYAAVFDQLSELLYNSWYEVFDRNYFDSALNAPELDLRFFSQHDKSKPVARLCPAKNIRSLTVEVDDHGLKFSFVPVNTNAGRDMIEEIRSGIIDACSIGHFCAVDEWNELHNGYPVRRLKICAKIEDLSCVTYPAWPTTEAALRNRNDINHMTEEDYLALFKANQAAPKMVPLSIREKELRMKMIDSHKFAC